MVDDSTWFVLRPVSSWRLGCDYGSLASLKYADADQSKGADWPVCSEGHFLPHTERTLPSAKLKGKRVGDVVWTRNGFSDLLFGRPLFDKFVLRFSEHESSFEPCSVIVKD